MNCSRNMKMLVYFLVFILIIGINSHLKKTMNSSSLLLLSFVIAFVLIFAFNVLCKDFKENFDSSIYYTEPNNYKYSMGPFSDLILKPGGGSNWRHPPSNLPLYKPSTLYSPQGTPLPLKDQAKITTLPKDSTGPSVDGTANAPKNMFMFAYNQCRPECCPSTFSCDRGCICTTKQQRHFINSRGTPQIHSRAYPGI